MSSGKKFNTAREQSSMASTVSASDAHMRGSDAFLRFVPDFVNPAPYRNDLDEAVTTVPLPSKTLRGIDFTRRVFEDAALRGVHQYNL